MKNKIIQNNLIICFAAVVVTALVCIATYSHFLADTLSLQAENQAYMLSEICRAEQDDAAALRLMADSLNSRVTLIDPQGRVLFDNVYDETVMENHLEREEIVQALQHSKGVGQRYSSTDGTTNYYCALRLDNGNILRVGVRANSLFFDTVLANLPVVVVAALAILVVVFILSAKVTEKIVSNIENFNFEAEDSHTYEELSPFIEKIKSQNAAIKKQRDKTTAEKDKLSAIFANMEESIIVCDRKKMVVQHNRQAGKIFGVKEGDRLFEVIEDKDLYTNMDTATEGNKTNGIITHNKLVYQYTISPNVQNGLNTGVIIIFLDITQQVESQKARRRFTANVTHELKTPLTSILGYSQLISSGIAKPQDVQNFAAIIDKNAQQLLNLIEDIMQLSALDEGVTVETALVDMKKLTEDILRDLQPVIDEKDIAVSCSMEKVELQANYKNMGDLCRNLISNAIKYNKVGGTIDISLEKQGSNAVFKVRDSGIGIAENHQQKIFQRFYVVDKSRNKNISSTGLGLAIVKHIAEGMHGTVELESKVGTGSCFTVTLPMEQG